MTGTGAPLLCATDLSTSGAAVLDVALVAARALGAPIVLAHVMDTGRGAEHHAPAAVAPAEDALHARIRARVDEAQRVLESEAARGEGVEIRTVILDGHPWEAIVAHAAELGAGAIVVGAHGASGPARILGSAALGRLLGSTADRVVRAARCPILVAPDTGAPPELAGGRWLVGLDLEPRSRHALETALALAARAGSSLDVVYVRPGPSPVEPRAQGDEDRAFAEAIGAIVADASAGTNVVTREALRHGDPATSLSDAATESDAALIVIGTQSRSGLQRAMIGSVAERVLRVASVPVLVVPEEV